MCDTEIHFDKPNDAHSDKILIENQRAASLSYLAFWSNPAWFHTTKHSAFPAAAIKEWVSHHRLSLSSNKETIAETIGSVKEVIPNSKLVQYGDFSYDIDYEDMYCIAEELSSKSYNLKANKSVYTRRYDIWASETETNIFSVKNNEVLYTDNKNDVAGLCCRVRSMSEWLKELNQVLLNVKKIANEAHLMDSWTETLLKFCLRFICSLRNNENLIQLLNSEISFIIDYEKLQKIPISEVELLSIPQPELKENVFWDNESVEALWLKFSRIRNIWKKNMRVPSPFDSEIQRCKHLVPLMKINFLRNHQSKSFHPSRQTTDILIDIPKNMEAELLGPLLNVINEDTSQSGDMLTKVDAVARNYFPEAHGEWTKNLFPHRVNLPKLEKDSAAWKPWNVASISQVPSTNVNLEHKCSETAILPIQYYKTVPPPELSVPSPTLAARFRLPLLNSQPRNKVLLMPLNDLTSNQQVQYKIPITATSCVPPAAYISQTSFSPNCSAPQRFSAPTCTSVTTQYQRLNFFRAPYQYHNLQSTKEPQKYPSKTAENLGPENLSTEKNLNEEKYMCDKLEAKRVNIPEPTNALFVQLSRGYNIPFRIQQNVGNVTAISNKTSHSGISYPQLRMRESRMSLKTCYPVTNIRCRTPLIKNTPCPKNPYISPQFTSKPHLLDPITINSLQRRQERMFQRKRLYNYANDPSNDIQKSASFESISSHLDDTRLHYEDKVEKWLKSVNKFVKPGSYINLEESELPGTKLPELCNIELPYEQPRSDLSCEQSRIELPKLSRIELPKNRRMELPEFSSIELPEHPRIELPDIYNKLHGGEKGDCKESGKLENENSSEAPELNFSQNSIKSLLKVPSNIIVKCYESKANYLKRKKIKAKREFYEHMQRIRDITLKLKSCKSLRSKIKIFKEYFVEINSTSIGRCHFGSFIKVLAKKNIFIRKVGQLRKKEFSEQRQQSCLGMKFGKRHATGRNLDMRQSNVLISDISKYKMLIRESQEFNTFPSKRMKLKNSQPSFFQTKSIIREQRDRWISSLNYFDSIIDELFFADIGIEGIFDGNQKKMVSAEVNGWTHFKVAVKTVMENIISSLKAENSQNL